MTKQRTYIRRTTGFTLIELLTVVAIIGILVGLLVPTLRAVIESKHNMEMQVRIDSLSTGCNGFKLDHGNSYYPGQDPVSLAALNGQASQNYPNCSGSGSALLARCLFTDPNGRFPVSNYGKYASGMVGTANHVPNSLIDDAGDVMAILYYPSHPEKVDQAGKVGQFLTQDNQNYTNNYCATDTNNRLMNIQLYVQGGGDSSSNSNAFSYVRQDGEFVITAAGKSRLYFGQDSLNNFSR